MNIIEAIKSGKPFRREGDAAWHDPFRNETRDTLELSKRDLLAVDWEIEEPTVTITRTQFLEAFGQMYCRPPWSGNVVDTAFGIELARKLGLGGP